MDIDAGDDDLAALVSDPIVSRLKVAYDNVASEPFPQHLLDLLERLEEVETKG